MGRCRDYDVCGLEDGADPAAGCCILHSPRPDKESRAFLEALQAHRRTRGDNFTRMVFPVSVDFGAAPLGTAFFNGAVFLQACDFTGVTCADAVFFHGAFFRAEAIFTLATFTHSCTFSRARFEGPAEFHGAAFQGPADFSGATFRESADWSEAVFAAEASFAGLGLGAATFRGVTFAGPVEFQEARFRGRPSFQRTRFVQGASFSAAAFPEGAEFQEAAFEGGPASFAGARFGGRTQFGARGEGEQRIPAFAGTEADFRGVRVAEPGGLVFREADLRRCRLLDSEAERIDCARTLWPTVAGRDSRLGVWDEQAAGDQPEGEQPWGELELLYRRLAQGAVRAGERERAGDFRYGEMEMRRRNPATPRSTRRLLLAYAVLAGYGERFLRPLLFALLLWLSAAVGYLALGLVSATGGLPLDPGQGGDWLRALHFSLGAMTLAAPWDLVAIGQARGLQIIQHLLGPLLLALLVQGVWRRIGR